MRKIEPILLKVMEQSTLVKKSVSSTDKRAIYFRITGEGESLLSAFIPYNFEAVEIIFSRFEPEDFKTLSTLLKKINLGTEKLTF